MKLRYVLIGTIAFAYTAAMSAENLILHYDRPPEFFEEALVIGNGKLGATVYSGINSDRLSLNDITLWTGEPDTITLADGTRDLKIVRELLDKNDYKGAEQANKKLQGHYSENYQPLGNLIINYNNSGRAENFYRQLDISDAIASANFDIEGTKELREYFVSSPDSVIVVKITSPKGLDFNLSYNSLLPTEVNADGNEIIIDGYSAWHSYPGYLNSKPIDERLVYDKNRGIHFRTIVRVSAPDSELTDADGTISVTGGKEAIILISNETSFNGFDKEPVKEGKDYQNIVYRNIEKAEAKAYDELKERHIADHRYFFDRVSIDLGETAPEIKVLPTDIQLRLYTDENQSNPDLEELYFQYGRYLLISCSRTPGVPANLQGLWNEKILPPWSSNYTTNINLEENYWLAENTNLPEMHESLINFIRNLSVNGEKTAKQLYGINRGWMLGHNTDIWAMSCPVGLNEGDPMWANWNMGGAWVVTHIWDRYTFNQDKDFLADNYDLLKRAAEFSMDWLVEKDGYLMTSPGTSPENRFRTPEGYELATGYGTTSDNAMIRECLEDAIKAANILGKDEAFVKRAEGVLDRLPPYKIGKNGGLQEWYIDWDEQDPHHRHQSHLFGLYPGHHISLESTPEIADAAHKTLELRGPESTGWSTGWRVNLYSRLKDSEMAYATYRKLLKYISPDDYKGDDARRGGGTYPNLLDAHAPFQIDGNFGGAAGVAEMLIQSTPEKVTLLPALPFAWKDGNVSGLRARGGFTVNMAWKDGKVTEATLTSSTGGATEVYFNGKSIPISLKAGETISINPNK
ncbi:MAG: glycoside hydrolase family 95 protein [Bacteroides sp.]|nr:glycoside hydrolase family 95 protein [Bacteroides sp.]